MRVKTYAHRLKLVEEALAEQAQARAELARRVAERREQLIQARLSGRAVPTAAHAAK